MFKKLDFYTATAPVALIVGFCWVYVTMVFLMEAFEGSDAANTAKKLGKEPGL